MNYIDIQTQNTGLFPCYRIPGIIMTAKGTLIITYECRLTFSDWDTRAVAIQRSVDGGKSWSEPHILAESKDLAVNNPVLVAGKDGTVYFFYSYGYSTLNLRISNDDGLTFDDEIDITSCLEKFKAEFPFNVCACGPGHGIEMSDGTLVVPVWLANGEDYEDNGHIVRRHAPSVCSVIYSENRGKTFRCGQIIGDSEVVKNANETSAAELSDGSLMLNIRSTIDERYRISAVSTDHGKSFSKPKLETSLPDPICFGSILSVKKNLLAFVNCANNATRDRINLTIKFSCDDGQTWSEDILINQSGGYSDLCASLDGKKVYVFFERDHESVLSFAEIEVPQL